MLCCVVKINITIITIIELIRPLHILAVGSAICCILRASSVNAYGDESCLYTQYTTYDDEVYSYCMNTSKML